MTEPIKVTGSDGKSKVLEPGIVEEFRTPVIEEKLPKAQDGLTIDNTSVNLPPMFDTEELIKQAEYLNRSAGIKD